MYRVAVISAWKWLLAHMVIAASASFLATVLFAGLGWVDPATILRTTTFGPRHVSGPILGYGMAIGIDEGIMMFLCNITVAMLILSILIWARLLNPYNRSANFSLLRKHLQKDRTAYHLTKIPYYARINPAQLRLSAFLLLFAPYVATITLGLLTGALLGSTYLMSYSPAIALAFIVPHGVPEIIALLLACSIPVGTWMAIKPMIDKEKPHRAFHCISRIATSQELQQDIKMIINLLLIAGLIEAHFTLEIVYWLIKS